MGRAYCCPNSPNRRGREATLAVRNKVDIAKAAIVARDDEDRAKFLISQGFAATRAGQMLRNFEVEEGHKPNSVWDFVQAITADARNITHQDARVAVERKAGAMMGKVN